MDDLHTSIPFATFPRNQVRQEQKASCREVIGLREGNSVSVFGSIPALAQATRSTIPNDSVQV